MGLEDYEYSYYTTANLTSTAIAFGHSPGQVLNTSSETSGRFGISVGCGVTFIPTKNFYLKTRYSYSYNVSYKNYFLPRIEATLGFRL